MMICAFIAVGIVLYGLIAWRSHSREVDEDMKAIHQYTKGFKRFKKMRGGYDKNTHY